MQGTLNLFYHSADYPSVCLFFGLLQTASIMPQTNPDRLPLPGQVVPFHYGVAIKTDVERGTFEGKASIQ